VAAAPLNSTVRWLVPYFFLAGALLLWVVAAAIAVAVTRAVPALRSTFPFAWRVAVWATLGVLVANVLLGLAVGAGLLVLPDSNDYSAAHDALGAGIAITAILGPFAASAVGWLGGAVLGTLLYLKTNRRTPPNTSLERTREG